MSSICIISWSSIALLVLLEKGLLSLELLENLVSLLSDALADTWSVLNSNLPLLIEETALCAKFKPKTEELPNVIQAAAFNGKGKPDVLSNLVAEAIPALNTAALPSCTPNVSILLIFTFFASITALAMFSSLSPGSQSNSVWPRSKE